MAYASLDKTAAERLDAKAIAAMDRAKALSTAYMPKVRAIWERTRIENPIKAESVSDVYKAFSDYSRLDSKNQSMIRRLKEDYVEFNKHRRESESPLNFSEFVQNLPNSIQVLYYQAMGAEWQKEIQRFAGPSSPELRLAGIRSMPTEAEVSRLVEYLKSALLVKAGNLAKMENLYDTAVVVVTDNKGNPIVRDGKPMIRPLFDPNDSNDSSFVEKQKAQSVRVAKMLSESFFMIKPKMAARDWNKVGERLQSALQLENDAQHSFDKTYQSKVDAYESSEEGKRAHGFGKAAYTFQKYETSITLAMLALGGAPGAARWLGAEGAYLLAAERLALVGQTYFAGTGLIGALGEYAINKQINTGVLISSAMALAIGGKMTVSEMEAGTARALIGAASEYSGRLVAASMIWEESKLAAEFAKYGLTPGEEKSLGMNMIFFTVPLVMGFALGEHAITEQDRTLARELYAERAEQVLILYKKMGGAFDSFREFNRQIGESFGPQAVLEVAGTDGMRINLPISFSEGAEGGKGEVPKEGTSVPLDAKAVKNVPLDAKTAKKIAEITARIEHAADEKIKSLEAMAKEIEEEANKKHKTSLAEIEEFRASYLESIENIKKQDVESAKDATAKTKTALQKQFEISKEKLKDPKNVEEAEKLLAAKMNAEDEKLNEQIAEVEAQYTKDVETKKRGVVSNQEEAKAELVANNLAARDIRRQIQETEGLKEDMLKRASSPDTMKSVTQASVDKAFSLEPEAEGPKRSILSKKAVFGTAVAFYILYHGLTPKHHAPSMPPPSMNFGGVTPQGASTRVIVKPGSAPPISRIPNVPVAPPVNNKTFVPLASTGMLTASKLHSEQTGSSSSAKLSATTHIPVAAKKTAGIGQLTLKKARAEVVDWVPNNINVPGMKKFIQCDDLNGIQGFVNRQYKDWIARGLLSVETKGGVLQLTIQNKGQGAK